MKKDFIELKNISAQTIIDIIECAKKIKHNNINCSNLSNKVAANLFFEPSTRTAYSFLIAEEKLNMKTIVFNPESSSIVKGESFYDTVKTFDSFGVDLIVIRHQQNNYYSVLKNKIDASIINAGDGSGNHPTQSLLDLLTIQEEFGRLDNLNIMIVGDIIHSRVAHTNFEVMMRLGMNVYTSGPEVFQEKDMNVIDFKEGLTKCDVIMMLRMQTERHAQNIYDMTDYNKRYGLNFDNIKLLKDKAIIMHPAPVSRNIEIIDELVESPRSRIFKQINNGVFIRMAVIKYLLG